ncbi:hypothetical protein [Dactylosporangium sp. NPDC048998]|uniref:hypothetical protein n=1 Tax=Dactylosporangium sp. NPDC048998 TaxID=3363976 RepID=UPI0037107C29
MTDFDSAGPFGELHRLREATARRDWRAVSAHFDGLTSADDHEFAASIVVDVPGVDDFLRDAVEWERGTGRTLARALHADRLISAGWEVRTSRLAKDVSREQFAVFHSYLRRAERILIEVTAEDPANPTAWTARLTARRGLQLGQAEARRRYDRCARHLPHFYWAQVMYKEQLYKKWGGEDERALAFARECLRAAPPGSLAALTVIWVHLEVGRGSGGDWDDRSAIVRYLQRPDVWADLEEAANRSVRHPAFDPGRYNWYHAHSVFAAVFGAAGALAAARPHFQAIGEHPMAASAWGTFGRPAEVFHDLRSRVMGA